MHFLPAVLAFTIAGLGLYNAYAYLHASGTVAQRLAAAWQGSLTIFTNIWGFVAVLLTDGLDLLANVTGDSMFGQWADAVKSVIPAQYHPLIPFVALSASILARQRTLPKKT